MWLTTYTQEKRSFKVQVDYRDREMLVSNARELFSQKILSAKTS